MPRDSSIAQRQQYCPGTVVLGQQYRLRIAELTKDSSMEKRELAGFEKKSFCMSFAGGEIWIEHLDGLYEHTELALQKFEMDYEKLSRPSSPSVLAINLDETNITETLIASITEALLTSKKRLRRVAFVGVGRIPRKIFQKKLAEATFLFAFDNDFEHAKRWLVTETR